MSNDFSSESLAALWKRFYNETFMGEVEGLANSFPQKKSLIVSFSAIETFDAELAYFLIGRPMVALYFAEVALNDELKVFQPEAKGCHLRITNLPGKPLARVDVRGLRTRHLGKLVAVQGIVRKMTQVKAKLVDGTFQCARCFAIIREPQPDGDFKEPIECYKDQGGCGKPASSTRFILLNDESAMTGKNAAYLGDSLDKAKSAMVDSQKIEIQESPEAMRGRDQPEKLVAYLEDDLCGNIYPGDKVVLNGVLRSQQRKYGNQKTNFFDWFLDVNSVEVEKHEFDEVEITADDELKILEMAKDPDLCKNIVQSIAPSIYGMDYEKEMIALQLFGGVPKLLPDNTRIRGDIHILLVGDPGTSKTQLLHYVSKLLPRGIAASGKATTGTGLTAAAVRDEFGEGRWTLEAGALVLADKGGVCIDELDKMSPQDASSMHEAMEQQVVNIAKAGITATFQCRCSILAAANPENGRFSENEYLADQITLSPPLLSRFDAIFPVVDKVERKKDELLAGHILKTHLAGELSYHRENAAEKEHTFEEEEEALKLVEPIYSVELLRKYIAYAKRYTCPVMKRDSMEALQQYYVNIRAQAKPYSEGGGSIPMTPRQIEALIRMSEAGARMRLSNSVELSDVDRAEKMVEYFLNKVASEGGSIDIDAIATGITHARRGRFEDIIGAIEELDDGRGVKSEDVMGRLKHSGYTDDEIDRDIKRLMSDGRLWNSDGNRYKVMRRGA